MVRTVCCCAVAVNLKLGLAFGPEKSGSDCQEAPRLAVKDWVSAVNRVCA